MTKSQILFSIIIMAVCTLITRLLPFLIFPEHRKTPPLVTYLGAVLPYAIIGMLEVYCFKQVSFIQYPFGIPEMIGFLFVIFVHRWKHHLLLSIGGGTLFYMILIRFVF